MKSIASCFAPLVVLLAALAAPVTADGQTVRYRVVPLTELPSAQASCVPTAINNNGDVVGYCGAGELGSFAVRWHGNGTVENLGKWQNGTFTHARGINAAGQVVGDGDDGDLKSKALVRGASGWIGIDGSGGSYQTAHGITDGGVIFGNFSTVGSPATETWDPVFWTYDARRDRYNRNDLPKPPGTPSTGFSGAFVFAVNSLGAAAGQVASDLVGNRAGFWKADASHALVILATPSGLGSAAAFAVSDDGRVAGMTYGVAGSEHAVLWLNDATHTPVDLGTLGGDLRSEAYGVNVAGQVIGASFGAAGRGFIYHDATLSELTTLLDTPYSAWTVNEPAGINDAGTIVAIATLNGLRHPVMLVPFEKVKGAQTISFTLPAGPFRFGDLPIEVSATSSSGLPVAFQASGACSVAGTTVTIVGTGMCQVTASQGGDADWEPAADVIQNTTIGKGQATVSFDAPSLAQIFDGAVKTVATSTTPTGLTVVVTFTGAPRNAGSYPVSATVDDLNYEGAASATLVVGKADASIVVTPYTVTYDGASHTATAAAAGVTGEDLSGFVSLEGTTHSAAGTYAADAWSFSGDANYKDASGTVADTIAPAAQAISFGALAGRTYGDPAFSVSAEGGASGNAVTFGVTGTCSVSGSLVTITGAGNCTVVASQAGSTNYAAAADVPQSFAIAPAAQSIVFAALANRTFGDAPFAVSASGGGSGNPVMFAAIGTCTVSANLVTLTAAGSCTITAAQAGNVNYLPAAPVSQSFTVAPAVPAKSPLVNPGPQINREGDEVELRLVETRMRGEFSALNLPDGLRIYKNGIIRGHVEKGADHGHSAKGAAPGSPYAVTVTYTAPNGVSSSVAFSWTILRRDPKSPAGRSDGEEKDDRKREGRDRR